jgi:hypothetical protein
MFYGYLSTEMARMFAPTAMAENLVLKVGER